MIVYIKGIYITIADTFTWLDFTPNFVNLIIEEQHCWMAFTKCWKDVNESCNKSTVTQIGSMYFVFVNYSKENKIYPLTIKK